MYDALLLKIQTYSNTQTVIVMTGILFYQCIGFGLILNHPGDLAI